MNLKETLFYLSAELKRKGIKTNVLDAELLLIYALKKSRVWLYSHRNYVLKNAELKKVKNLLSKRLEFLPMAYITKNKKFYGLDFYVNKNVLVPRPESELILEEVFRKKYRKISTVIDLGTGSGNLIISLAKNFSKKIFFKAIDISSLALYVAKKNAEKHKVKNKIKFFQGDLLIPFLKRKEKMGFGEILIIANLPYLSPEQFKNEISIQKEPRIALVSGKDGLKEYRRLFQQLKKFQKLSLAFGYISKNVKSPNYLSPFAIILILAN